MECWRRKKEKAKERKWFLKNGSMFLEQLIVDCNGISNPIHMFSSDQISKATSHFDHKCSLPTNSSSFTWYKGVIKDRSYVIKRFTKLWHGDDPYTNIVISNRVSNYNGFLKLIGCCLEYPHPVFVFEDLEYRFLNQRGSVGSEDAPLLPWNVRLKIAIEVATAISYLHTGFPRTIIHRDIKVDNVLLDKNGRAKLTGLSKVVTLPEGKSWVEEPVLGTYGYVDPIYFRTGIVTEYSDVFSFGILMLVLITGRPADLVGPGGRCDPHRKILDYVRDRRGRGEPIGLGDDSNNMIKPGQTKMFLDLALRCCKEKNEDRPKMISVAKEIKLIEKNITQLF